MKGSIQKRPGARGVSYRARVEYTPDPITGERRQRSKTFRTRREADAALARWLAEIDRGTALEPSKLTVGQLLNHRLTTVAKHNVKATTYEDYEATIRLHILPALGTVPVQRLTAPQVQAFYASKLHEGASARTVQLCHLRLSQALAQGVSWGLVHVNVCASVKSPKVVYKQADAWSVEEAEPFLASAAEDSLNPLWLVALTTGLRRGELLGLRWRDLDLDRSALSVRQEVVVYKGAPLIEKPKTPSARRVVRLLPETVEALREHRKRWVERRLVAGSLWQDYDLVFCTALGKPLNPNNVARSYEAIIKRAGVRRIRFHDLRHTHATWLLQSGVPVKVVSERLGHAKVSTTLDIYAHVLPDMQEQAMDALGAMMFAKNREAS